MSTSKERDVKKNTRRTAGIRTIDTNALRRMISWSIESCERQLMTLYSAREVLGEEIEKSRKK